MCGIWGFVTNHAQDTFSLETLREASDAIQPRGPERTTSKMSPNYHLVFHRLAINGLEEGNDQPYIYEEKGSVKYIVLCNGEIYNKTELEHEYCLGSYGCDTRVIYPVWKALQYDFVALNNVLRGEYALVILQLINEIPTKLFASVDPCSVRPLFYHINKEQHYILFSSLLAGIAPCKVQASRLHGGEALTHDFSFGQTRKTYYFDWFPRLSKELEQDKYALRSTIYHALNKAIDRRMLSDRPIGCFLSGGLDSSLVAALVARRLRAKGQVLHTYSIGALDSGDVIHAEKVARHIGSKHTVVPFDSDIAVGYIGEVIKATETFDITTIRASMGQYLISKYIKEEGIQKVVFSGDGSDEAFGSYVYFYNAPSGQSVAEESRKLLKEIHLYDGLRVDRCVSVHGLEARVPYLDADFVSLCLSIPGEYKWPKVGVSVEKHLLRQAFMSNDPHLLPQCVLWRTKETFSDSLSTSETNWYAKLKAFISHESGKAAYKALVANMRLGWKHCIPKTEESEYYRVLFTLQFGELQSGAIPHIWMPNWSNATDPSARTYEMYKQIQA